MALSNGTVKKYNSTKDLLSGEQQDVLRGKGNKIERLQSEITHLSKPLLQTEGSLEWSKHVTPGTLAVFQDEKSWNGISSIHLDKKNNTKEFKDMNGLSWNQMKDLMQLDFEEDTMSEEGSPVTTRLDAKDMDVFGLMPMEEDIVVVKCTNCHRPLLPSKFKEHSESCIGNNLFLDEEEEEETKKKKKRVLSLEDELNIPTAKRPPSASLEKNEKKMLKKDKQKKTAKQKAPLDLDKQCGVIQGPNQTPCTRSLTCKSHSMSAKRAVEGRSQPYDVLLAAYQKKSIGRPNGKEVASKKKEIPTSTSSNGILSTAGKSIKNLKKFQSQSVSSPTANDMSNNSIHKSNSISMQAAEETFVDSDEEVESVLQAFKFSKPMPLAQKSFFFTKRKRQCFRLRDILLDAITPKPLNDSKMTSTETLDSRPNHLMQQRQQQQQQQQQQHTNFGYALMNDNSLFVDSVNSFSL